MALGGKFASEGGWTDVCDNGKGSGVLVFMVSFGEKFASS